VPYFRRLQAMVSKRASRSDQGVDSLNRAQTGVGDLAHEEVLETSSGSAPSGEALEPGASEALVRPPVESPSVFRRALAHGMKETPETLATGPAVVGREAVTRARTAALSEHRAEIESLRAPSESPSGSFAPMSTPLGTARLEPASFQTAQGSNFTAHPPQTEHEPGRTPTHPITEISEDVRPRLERFRHAVSSVYRWMAEPTYVHSDSEVSAYGERPALPSTEEAVASRAGSKPWRSPALAEPGVESRVKSAPVVVNAQPREERIELSIGSVHVAVEEVQAPTTSPTESRPSSPPSTAHSINRDYLRGW
jgi:hypothetical protein